MINPLSQPIRVVIVDDHTMVRRGLATFLKVHDDLQLVGEAENGEEAIQLCACVMPDVVLMDIIMPIMDGVAATRIIRHKFPNIRVIMLTSFMDEKLINDALASGAIGYLVKNVLGEEMARAIRAAHAGHVSLAQEVAQVLVDEVTQSPIPGIDLTEREREVLNLMIEGLNNTQIAAGLNVSTSTIKTHVSNILSKLGVTSRTEAVTHALRSRILP